jgi:hypothetical protein
MTEQQQNEQLTIGLKTQVKRQVGLKKWETQQKERTIKHLIKSWLKLDNCAPTTDYAKDLIWDYIDNDGSRVFKKIQSKDIGIFTYIDDYTKKNGEIIKVHYSADGNYIGTVKKLGNEPISYLGWFIVNKKRFKIDLNQSCEYSTIADLFVPK